jgi:hypothetical protein
MCPRPSRAHSAKTLAVPLAGQASVASQHLVRPSAIKPVDLQRGSVLTVRSPKD